MNMTIEQVAKYFINNIATRPIYAEDPHQRWYRICNEVYQLLQYGWQTDELAHKFYERVSEFPNIVPHAYYVQDVLGYAQPKAHQPVPVLVPNPPISVDVPWQEEPEIVPANDPFTGFVATPVEQPIEYGAPAQIIEQDVVLQGEPEIILPERMESLETVGQPTETTTTPQEEMKEEPKEVTKENPWGDQINIAMINECHAHKERLGLDNETIIPHIRHYLEQEEATISSLTPENIQGFNQYLSTIQS